MSAEIRDAAQSPRAIRIPAGAATLGGEVQLPSDPQGLVLIAHAGPGGVHAPPRALAAQLRAQGLGTVLLDLLTPEEAAAEALRGRLCLNIGLLTQRLVSAAHWVGGEDEARHQRLGFLASDTIAAAALVAAADLGRVVGAVVLLQGRPDLAGGALRRAKCPVLMLVDRSDDDLWEYNEEALGLLTATKELQRFAGQPASPGGSPDLSDAVGRAADWFHQHLGHSSAARFRR
ncbi:MAG: hypothetical protein RJA22_256 [Verrucomicrobiota bacterium]|jgi:hypothetical protein